MIQEYDGFFLPLSHSFDQLIQLQEYRLEEEFSFIQVFWQ